MTMTSESGQFLANSSLLCDRKMESQEFHILYTWKGIKQPFTYMVYFVRKTGTNHLIFKIDEDVTLLQALSEMQILELVVVVDALAEFCCFLLRFCLHLLKNYTVLYIFMGKHLTHG